MDRHELSLFTAYVTISKNGIELAEVGVGGLVFEGPSDAMEEGLDGLVDEMTAEAVAIAEKNLIELLA